MRTAKRILSYVLTAMMMLSMLTVNAGAISLSSSNIEASDIAISEEQIISPADAVYVSDDCKVNFSVAMQGGSKIHFLLDGKKFHEFDVTDDTSMQTYSVNAKLIDEIWGYRTFTVEKYDAEGNLLSSLDKFVKLSSSKYEFMELYPVKTNGTVISGYDIRDTADDVKYGYPRIEKPTSEYSSIANNQYVFGLTAGLSCGTLAYYDDDGDGKKDSIKATYKSNSSSYTTFFNNYIQLLQANTNLLNAGGIIEIKFKLKLADTTSSRVALMGLPGWRANDTVKNNPTALYPLMISKTTHFFTSNGASMTFETTGEGGTDPTAWNDYRLLYDTDNKTWTFHINEGKPNAYTATAPMEENSTITGHATNKTWFNGSKGIFLGHYMYPGETGNGGFTAKDFHVTRYNDAPQIDEILVDGEAIANEKISIEAQTISGTLTSAYDDITESDICFSVNGNEITGGEFVLGSDNTSFSYTIPDSADIKSNDKVAFYIKGSAKTNGISTGINQGFVLKGSDPLIDTIEAAIDADDKAGLNLSIDRSKLTKDTPLVLLCVYDKVGNLIAIDSAFIEGDTATLEIPYSKINDDIKAYKSTLFIAEGGSQAEADDYLNIRCFENIKWQ